MKQRKALPQITILVAILALVILSCSGASGIPGLFATETPTATMTFTPSPTATPSPTPTETRTPSPTPLPTGVKMVEQSDGSTLFIDYDNKYQLTLPKDWLVIPLSSEDLSTILTNLSEKNSAFKEVAESFKQLDPDVIRVIAVNADAKYLSNGFSTNLTITAIEDKLMSSMPLDFVTGAVEESLKQQGSQLVSESSPVTKNSNGVEIGTFVYEKATPTATGKSVQAHSKIVLFQSAGRIIMLQLATLKQFEAELFPVIDTAIDSIKLLEP